MSKVLYNNYFGNYFGFHRLYFASTFPQYFRNLGYQVTNSDFATADYNWHANDYRRVKNYFFRPYSLDVHDSRYTNCYDLTNINFLVWDWYKNFKTNYDFNYKHYIGFFFLCSNKYDFDVWTCFLNVAIFGDLNDLKVVVLIFTNELVCNLKVVF